MQTPPRRRRETILLAILAIASVLPLRFYVESRVWFLAEFGTLLALFAAVELIKTFGAESGRSKLLTSSATTLLAIAPVLFAILARSFGSAIAFEMSTLSAFGSVSLAVAVAAKTDRTRAMSLVASGFLVLFATSISEHSQAVWIAVAWMSVCVWHLVANHWEKLDVCLPDSVRPTVGVRPASVLVAVVLCIAGGLAVRNHVGPANRMTNGVMPTSGGSKWSDPAARSGIGSGDAAIAAKDHAESFGAVESEIFLESTESSLFDMVNEMIGEPKQKMKWDRRQAMGNENLIPMHDQAAKSEKGGSSFSTDRMPPKKHRHFEDAKENAVIQWAGPTGIRLAMERFDTFDGVDWTNTVDRSNDKLSQREIDKKVWFFDPKLESRALSDSDLVTVNLLKVLRLDSTRFPAPMMTAGLHIKDVNRQDFFGIEHDGSLFMPERDKIPPLTVVNLASIQVMEDELWDRLAGNQTKVDASQQATSDSASHPYQQLQDIVDELRTEFTFDRNTPILTANPVEEFLQTRRGGDHLFATVAALKAREIGLQSRLVTGFYVPPDAYDISAGHANITPEDVHFWVEIKLDDGRWFELEPTPGYEPPVYKPSLWLSTKRFAAAHWMHGLLIAALGVVTYLTRLIWIDWLLTAAWSLSLLLPSRKQLGIAMRIVETRASLIGKARPTGKPQRDWLETLVIRNLHMRDHVQQFCDVADQATFGKPAPIDRRRVNSLVRALNTKQLKSVTNETMA
jgi:hypothetical protein